jgi:hypothetical protein
MAYVYTSPVIGGQPMATVEVSAQHALGTIVRARDNSGNGGEAEFMYVQCSSSITQYDAVVVKGGYKIAQLTITNGLTSAEIAFAQTAMGTKDTYGWVMKGGRPIVRLALGCQPSVPLFATATGGVLDDVSSSVVVQGVMAITQVTNSAGQATCIARFPVPFHELPG